MFTKTIGKICQTPGCPEKGELREPAANLCESCSGELAARTILDKRRVAVVLALVIVLASAAGFVVYQKIRATVVGALSHTGSQAVKDVVKGVDQTTSSLNKSGQPQPANPVSADCTDTHVAAALKDRFAGDVDLKPYDIQVDVANKTVILSGSVSSDLERIRAAEIVQISGCPVASLVNDLSIGLSDNALTTLIQKEYRSDSDLRTQHVTVEVSYGNVVLSGSVSENIMRTVAASKASAVHGVKTVTNNITVVPVLKNPKRSSVEGEGTPTQPSPNSEAHRATLSGGWTGTFTSCAQGQSDVHVNILESAPDDITADIEIEVPRAASGTFTAHGVLNTMNNFLSLQFSGWQHQPPGLIMGNIGGYVTFTDQGPTEFTGIIKAPGCGQIALKKG